MKTALIITTYSRPEYLKRCFESLRHLAMLPDVIIIVDDCSTDEETLELIRKFRISNVWIGKIFLPKNRGIKNSLLEGCSVALSVHPDLLINLDGDAIVKPDFIKRLTELHTEHPDHIISGFNSLNVDAKGNLRNPIIEEHENHYLKKHANGINMCFTPEQYEKHIKPALRKAQGNWDYDSTNSKGFVIAKPSLVQHIGVNSSMGHTEDPDVAADFFELSLPTVALFGVDAHDPKGLLRAADICTKSVEFGAVRIVTERLFTGREEYSRFMIRDLWDHVKYLDVTHVLTIHPDGFIVNPSAWDPEWLQCDYIGATWLYKDGKNVGNGGFSLRSKKFIEACSKLDTDQYHPEDCILCRRFRPELERQGMVWATEEQANRFSIEAYGCSMQDTDGSRANEYSGSFGFHGYGVAGLPIQPAPRHGVTATKRIQPTQRRIQTFTPNGRRR